VVSEPIVKTSSDEYRSLYWNWSDSSTSLKIYS